MMMGLPEIPMLIGKSNWGMPLTLETNLSSNFPQTLLYIVTVIGISECGGSSPICGLKTIAMPLLF